LKNKAQIREMFGQSLEDVRPTNFVGIAKRKDISLQIVIV